MVEFVKDHQIERDKRKVQHSSISNSGFWGGAGDVPQLSPQEKEKRMKLLTDLGANRVQAEALLKRCNWDPDLAAGMFIDARR